MTVDTKYLQKKDEGKVLLVNILNEIELMDEISTWAVYISLSCRK